MEEAMATPESASNAHVCVTGASGFIASELVRQLLEQGYRVKGTVRSTSDPKKVDHLRALPGAAERLKLVEADLLEEGSFDAAVAGCTYVHHTSSPFFTRGITDPEAQLLKPAVEGTLNVLRSCSKAGTVKRVVLTSSMAAVRFDRLSLDHEVAVDEGTWSDEALAREKGSWYPLSKTLAERAAWDYVAEHKDGFDLVAINPCLVVGPIPQPTLNTSSLFIKEYLDGTRDKIHRGCMGLVDVRDVAEAHLVAMERADAEGRYILDNGPYMWEDICEALRRLAPAGAKVPTEVDSPDKPVFPPVVSHAKVEALLGRPLRGLEDMLQPAVQDLQVRGFWVPDAPAQ